MSINPNISKVLKNIFTSYPNNFYLKTRKHFNAGKMKAIYFLIIMKLISVRCQKEQLLTKATGKVQRAYENHNFYDDFEDTEKKEKRKFTYRHLQYSKPFSMH